MTTHSTLGAQFAGRISLGNAVCVAIRQAYEQWDGKGYPDHLRGEQICLPARLVQLASPVEVFSRRRGVEAAVTMARKHRGPSTTPRSWTCSAPTRLGSCRPGPGFGLGCRPGYRAAALAPGQRRRPGPGP